MKPCLSRAALPALASLLAAALLAGCATPFFWSYPSLPKNAVPPVVAVSSFDNKSGFAGQWELGSGMADMLVSELLRSRNFVVVERGHLDTVVDEIHRQKNRMFRSEGRVDEGRLKNARYLIRGVINDFSQYGGGSLGVAFKNVLSLGRGGYRARVALTLTIVDVESGEIVGSLPCSALAAAHESYASGTYKNVTFGGDTFLRTPLGEATAEAIHDGVYGLLERVPRIFWEPMIADIVGRSIALNGGSRRGFRTGQCYEVHAAGRPVTDPATGDLLAVLPGAVLGTLRVTDVQKEIAWAEPLRGARFERGLRLVPVKIGNP